MRELGVRSGMVVAFTLLAGTAQALVPLALVEDIDAGTAHTCVRTSGGGAKCWGSNDSGQLGDGTRTRRTVPVDVALGGRVLVGGPALGVGHSCAVARADPAASPPAPDDNVVCWGANDRGQLGDGTTTTRLTPVAVRLSGRVDSLAVGGDHGCALLAGGTAQASLRCWGWNEFGQLGDGSQTHQLIPVAVAWPAGATPLATMTGGDTTCATYALDPPTAGLRCWGVNNTAQLGDGSTTNRSRPTEVPGLLATSGALRGGGITETCIVTSAGGVKCWGYNILGGVGDGTTTPRPTPVDVAGLGPGSGVRSVASGSAFSCALLGSGGVACWGVNNLGQLGDGTTVSRYTPGPVAGLGGGVRAIAVGDDHACAVLLTGGVKCWGSNAAGQLGDGTLTNRLTPVDVVAGAPASVTVTSNANPAAWGTPVLLTATLAGGAGVPSGSITFRDGERELGSVALVDGKAGLLRTGLAAGAYPITADYSGDSAYAGALSRTYVQTVNVPGASGSITASPSLCALSTAPTCSATISWSSTGAANPSVHVRVAGGEPALFAAGPSGAVAVPWVSVWGATFELRTGPLPTDPVLASTFVAGAVDGRSAVTPLATLVADTNPCAVSAGGTCTTTIRWTTTSTPAASLWVHGNDGPPALVAIAPNGTLQIPWITPWPATFDVRAGPARSDPVLASLTVYGVLGNGAANVLTASPNPCVLGSGPACTSTLSWRTAGGIDATLWVRPANGGAQLVAAGPAGSVAIPWITAGGLFFELHGGPTAADPVLGFVYVVGVAQAPPPTLQSLVLTPVAPTVAAGGTVQMLLTGSFSDGSQRTLVSDVVWTSSNPGAAQVDANGLVRAVAYGEAIVQAKVGGLTAATIVTVPKLTDDGSGGA